MVHSYLRFTFFLVLLLNLLHSEFVHVDNFSQSKVLNSNWRRDVLDDEAPAVAMDDAGRCVTVWQRGSSYGPLYRTFDIFTSHSSDAGKTWSKKSVLNSNADVEYSGPIPIDGGYQNISPSIATDNHGTWLCVWQWSGPIGHARTSGYNILAARSTDNGATWSRAKVVNTDYFTPGFTHYFPHVASDESGCWICVWAAPYEDTGKYYWGVFGAISANNGKTWSDPRRINTEGEEFIGTVKAVTDCHGTWIVAWLKPTENGAAIAYATSTNNGATWSQQQRLTSNTDFIMYEDFSIATDRLGAWMTTFGGYTESAIDIFEAHSTDNAAAWSLPRSITPSDDTELVADNQPAVATDCQGRWIVMWERQTNTYPYAESIVKSETTSDFSTWSKIKPIHRREPTKYMPREISMVSANRNGNWLALWEWRGSDIDIIFATSANTKAFTHK